MSELPPVPADDMADPFWNRKRIGLALLVILLVLILVATVLVSSMPTICCSIFSNIVDSL